MACSFEFDFNKWLASTPEADLDADGRVTPDTQEAVYIAVWQKGKRIFWRWYEQTPWEKALNHASEDLDSAQLQWANESLQVELNLTHAYQKISLKKLYLLATGGLHGLRINLKGQKVRVSPTEPIIQNVVGFKDVMAQFFEQARLSEKEFLDAGGQIELFSSKQRLITLPSPESQPPSISSIAITPFYRAQPLVSVAQITQESVLSTAHLMAQWMHSNLSDSGRLTYLFWPSLSIEANGNNMIRQFMGTLCLFQWADFQKDRPLRASAERNLAYNIDSFFRSEAELGWIEEKGHNGDIKIKLGACALAAMSLLFSEQFQTNHYQKAFQGLSRLIDSLWQPDGSFHTFHLPKSRNDCQNFYPGEALLFWAEQHERTADEALLKHFYQSVAYYQRWHQQNPNPAFIPWHTQAYYKIWKINQDTRLKEAIFRMNDWLLSVQQWEGNLPPDIQGRFFNLSLNSGPPHASATGVYLESLIDAYSLAKATQDKERQTCYRVGILRGIRSLMQLQFKGVEDMFYVRQPEKVLGGIRTTVMNNTIRVDNVQHSLMALIRILQRLELKDYN